ncbi:MAG: hypothetical protein CL558_13155 [Alphaproteobacteria bacterium]|nr:hypothetical protein [Alphaproteobacteria bacterium]MAS46465.1 hypothetical protein [Alphaproteobacteria bacterium]MAX94560.1 hypothetical protein [Alphaproteobacteria bacterium]MBN54512.1 hypothetical protein [Alphaproteobacteria bacterium]OUT41939.1 MAG: hypothetical protein CBB62_06430 [Micavibrio sp. TMED2]|tara:strand:- start:2816 stop:3130 length:315 start_codon:yes stop_codon:yes gene_type:complete
MMEHYSQLLDISAERKRQVAEEGFTADHDDQNNSDGELALAAVAYTLEAAPISPANIGKLVWPWPDDWWKPGEPREMLVKAGALILAEIERLDREQAKKQVPHG